MTGFCVFVFFGALICKVPGTTVPTLPYNDFNFTINLCLMRTWAFSMDLDSWG